MARLADSAGQSRRANEQITIAPHSAELLGLRHQLEAKDAVELHLSRAADRVGDRTDLLTSKSVSVIWADRCNHRWICKRSTREGVVRSVEARRVGYVEDLHRQAKTITLPNFGLLIDGEVCPLLEAAAEDIATAAAEVGLVDIARRGSCGSGAAGWYSGLPRQKTRVGEGLGGKGLIIEVAAGTVRITGVDESARVPGEGLLRGDAGSQRKDWVNQVIVRRIKNAANCSCEVVHVIWLAAFEQCYAAEAKA